MQHHLEGQFWGFPAFRLMSEFCHSSDFQQMCRNERKRTRPMLCSHGAKFAEEQHSLILMRACTSPRIEATGYGLIYFLQNMLVDNGGSLSEKRIAISGKGNVATHAERKSIDSGGKVVTLSDTAGTLVAENVSHDAVTWVQERKVRGEDISDPPRDLGLKFHEGAVPWGIEADIALPCATQNEMDESAAKNALDGGVTVVAEGANMPLTAEALRVIEASDAVYAPGKAANAGGVAISGL